MYNNNIPQYNNNMQSNYRNNKQNNGDRFIRGGFFGPFILGGLTGGLIANSRYNYPMYYVPYYPYPYYYRPY